MQEVAYALPEACQRRLHSRQSAYGLGFLKDAAFALGDLLGFLTQPLGTAPSAICRYHLIGYLIVTLQLGITLSHLSPYGSIFHQPYHIGPLRSIAASQGFGPQVRILVYRRLRHRYPRIDIYLPTDSEAVRLAPGRPEKTHMVCNLQVFVIENHVILRTIGSAAMRVVRPTAVVYAMLSYFYVVFYCILGISAYLCSVNVKDSVLDVCIRGGFAPSIGSLVRQFSPHGNGFHIIRAVFVFFLSHYNISVAKLLVESYGYSTTHIIASASHIIGRGHNVWHKLHISLCQRYTPLFELPPFNAMILLRMHHTICRNIMTVKVSAHSPTHHTLCRFGKLYGKDFAALVPVKPCLYCI